MKLHLPILLSALVLSGTAQAATESYSVLADTPFYLGGGVAYAPRYPGSKEYTVVPLFNASVLFKNGFFVDGNQGAGYQLKFTDNFYATAALGSDLGRNDRNDLLRPGADRLRGLGEIRASVLASVGLGYRLGDRASVGLVVSKPLDHAGYGAAAALSGHLVAWKGEQDSIDLDTAVHYGNADYNNTWFGITPAQARRSGFASYAPASGIYAVDAGVTWSHQLDEHWFTRLSGSATRYMSRVAQSPLVEERTGYVVAASLNYRF